MPPLLGCIADDVTGASDLANALTVGGMRTQLWFGALSPPCDNSSVDAIVIALKTRSAPPEEAVTQSLAALRSLQACGVQHIVFKVCSTFDSTSKGNIGPVAEALMASIATTRVLFCPATPENGRTVYFAHLFVKGALLHRSGMEHHPLNPMTESDLRLVLGSQTKQEVGFIPHSIVTRGPEAIVTAVQANLRRNQPLMIIDAIDDRDLLSIAEVAATMPLVTSGAGLGLQLPGAYFRAGKLASLQSRAAPPIASGNALVLAGSCSQATQRQVQAWPGEWPAFRLDVAALVRGDVTLTTVQQWAHERLGTSQVLIYSTSESEKVQSLQQTLGVERTAAAIEEIMGGLARALVPKGTRKLIVAGGETAGAVVRALQLHRFRIGPTIAPGVPWMETLEEPQLAIALKSGNFGDEHFFRSALEMLP